MFAVSGLAALLFLGGWHTGLLPFEPTQKFGFWWGNLLNLTVFVGKCWVLVLVMIWIRWSFPRLRIDQVMTTCLKYFLPISCVLLVGVCLWQLLVPASLARAMKYTLAISCVSIIIGVIGTLFRSAGTASVPSGELPGAWGGQPSTLPNRK